MPSTMVIPIPVDRWDSEAVIEDDESSHRRQFGTIHNAAWQPVWHSICSEQNLVGVINILAPVTYITSMNPAVARSSLTMDWAIAFRHHGCAMANYPSLLIEPTSTPGDAEYGIGVDCDGPVTVLPPASQETPPYGWFNVIPCAVDNPDRVLSDPVVFYRPSNTVNDCLNFCASQSYHWAGVEYSDECYCGTGFTNQKSPPFANDSDCNMRCSGEYQDLCGGPWRMQIYSNI
ncbi:hypothetical protein PHLCEN_2v12141 [Hermanssonia centrifuga]|uniref:WSC domain-containing protein n=1 Tax=Hermanssonia centrifuga TaxID=98765 RepID=A0A2R6NI16_9APHY|nr:hypothetical protein PHLCEN_2v12141 [Hermanssonia centrifuga]